jgi:signal transduction histidine kinase
MGINDRLSEDVESALYRIIQEAITNVIRHANATRIDVLIEQRGERVVVIIEDNGTGFDPATLTHPEKLGLIGMRERAEMLGGSLTIESDTGNGTNLFVEVPCVYSNTTRG